MDTGELFFNGLSLNPQFHTCTLNGHKLTLTPTEFTILQMLMEQPGRVFSAEELFHGVWGEEYWNRNNNTIATHIRHLRRKCRTPEIAHCIFGQSGGLVIGWERDDQMEKLRRSVGKLFFAGKPYRAMVQKIYREMLGVMAKSFLIILAIRVLGYQKIGNFLTELLMQLKDCSWSEAQSLYFTYIRSNIEYLMFMLFCSFSLYLCGC